MTEFPGLLLQWEPAAAALLATVLGLAIARMYRTSPAVLGAPTTLPPPQGAAPGYRDESSPALSPYHAAHLINPRILPGLVALGPLFSQGVLGVDRGRNRLTAGGETASLDRFQQLATEQAVGFQAWPVSRSLSTQVGRSLEEELRGTALQSPTGGRGVPAAANACLWLTALGLAATLVSVAGPWGGVASSLVLVAAFRAHRYRSLARGMSLSRAGWEVLREQERVLDQRIVGLEGDEFEPEDVAWYVALKPVPYSRLPGLDDRFVQQRIGEEPVGIPLELGPKLTEEELEAAKKTNRRRSLGLWATGVLILGLGASSVFAIDPSPLFWLNVGITAVVGLRVGLGVLSTRRNDWVRASAPRFYAVREKPRG